jgi:hypothetical protein
MANIYLGDIIAAGELFATIYRLSFSSKLRPGMPSESPSRHAGSGRADRFGPPALTILPDHHNPSHG